MFVLFDTLQEVFDICVFVMCMYVCLHMAVNESECPSGVYEQVHGV